MRFPSTLHIARGTMLGTGARLLSTSSKVPLLLSPEQYKKLPKASTVPVDCSWHMPNSPRSAVAEYLTGPRLPRARRFDLDEVAELEPSKNPLSLTHMLPSKARFQEECRKLGINNDDHVVLYDTVGVFSSPRGAFTFKCKFILLSSYTGPLGHDKVSILDGGLPRWVAEGHETETSDTPDFADSQYTVDEKKIDQEAVRTYEQIVENAGKEAGEEGAEVVLEHRALARQKLGGASRSKAEAGLVSPTLDIPERLVHHHQPHRTGRAGSEAEKDGEEEANTGAEQDQYTGEAPEPRPSLSSGHIPNSLPLPFTSYLSPATSSASQSDPDSKPYTNFRSPEELRDILVAGVGGSEAWKQVKEGKGVVFTCGSGMTAAVGWVANEVVKEKLGEGATRTAIYDESWTGYASREESKIVKGDKP